MMNYSRILTFLVLVVSFQLNAQVTLDPFFASQNDSVVVYYDATKGNGALVGQSQIYAHAGLITTESTSPTDWKFVQGSWGTADPSVEMTNEGNDIHSIGINIPTFYGFPGGTEVISLAFVFRNADGSIVGRTSTGNDIFVPLYDGYGAVLLEPLDEFQIIDQHQTIDIQGIASTASTMRIWIDDSAVAEVTSTDSIDFTLNTIDFGGGSHSIILESSDGNETLFDTAQYLFREPTVFEALPAGTVDGANYIDDSTVVLMLTCPIKEFAFVIGDFTEWEINSEFAMRRTPDSTAFWIEITGLESDVELRYQFVVGEDLIRIADPYTHKILDPWNDPSIPASTYPDLIPYPTGKSNEAVSILHINRQKFEWDESFSYERPAVENLRIYELLIRDFTEERTYQSVIDSLDYLDRLGINAIELMPVNEFEGNNSWGYNPSFYFAPDKYYGTEEKLKELIEEAHKRGIAIILDMVLNHSFGQSPLVRLFFDGAANKPTAENPWFLTDAAHDFNVGYDFDHESPYTEKFVDDVMRFWVEEYRIDGYRMDLSKGFTSNITIGNAGAWGQYDEDRIENLTRMGEEVWAIDSGIYIILEHFANNDEEEELSDRGFMLWGNINHDFNENTMGYGANVSWSSYKNRGWADPHLISYMESHDEERLMYRNKLYGNETGEYSTKKTWTALKRMEQAAVYFFSTPGPKMIWQFGEMGYDLSINRCENGSVNPGCRLSPKPPRWHYLDNSDRKRLFEVYAAMQQLREEHEVFATDNFTMNAGGIIKNIKFTGDDMSVVTLCNFDVAEQEQTVSFPEAGTWYEYFSGDSIVLDGMNFDFTLAPGDYRLYTSVRLDQPNITNGIASSGSTTEYNVFPNPTSDRFTITSNEKIDKVDIMDAFGRLHRIQRASEANSMTMDLTGLASGTYLIRIASGDEVTHKMITKQ